MSCIHHLLHSQNLTVLVKHQPLRIHGARRLESTATPDPRTAVKYAQQKLGRRGGQNLTNRDVRLSKSVRQKQAFSRVGISEVNALDPSSSRSQSLATREDATVSPTPPKPRESMFRGMVIPYKPRPPEPDECCMSGCSICVYDLYLSSLESYRDAVASLRSTLQAQQVPVSMWPAELKENSETDNDALRNSELTVSMSAFAALEKELRESKGA